MNSSYLRCSFEIFATIFIYDVNLSIRCSRTELNKFLCERACWAETAVHWHGRQLAQREANLGHELDLNQKKTAATIDGEMHIVQVMLTCAASL
jgi:hypothetical protein